MKNSFNATDIFLLFIVLFVCSTYIDIDKPVKKSKLIESDYRLFQGTPAWPMARAAHFGDLKSVEAILNENPELSNIQDSVYGNTVLMLSIIHRDKKLFKLLLDHGANVNIHNTKKGNGASPITLACSYPKDDCYFVRELIEHGADVNDTTHSYPYASVSPLFNATSWGNLKTIKYLISQGADINYRNRFGDTPLGNSLSSNEYEAALVLLINGADFISPIYYTIDNKGKNTIPVSIGTSLRNATVTLNSNKHKKKRKVIEFLRSRGYDYDTVPIPEHILERIKQKYPDSWEDYIQKY